MSVANQHACALHHLRKTAALSFSVIAEDVEVPEEASGQYTPATSSRQSFCGANAQVEKEMKILGK